MTTLILASSSQYRRKLLSRLKVPFESHSPDIDESQKPGESPENLVKRLSAEKASALASAFPNHLIIGSDQVAVLGTDILTKPGCYDAAFQQLSAQSGKRVQFLTGLALLNSNTGHIDVDIVTTTVAFRELSNREISDYLHLDKPYDCAGSFKSEGLGISLFEGIHGTDPTALIGLPLIKLGEMLRKNNNK